MPRLKHIHLEGYPYFITTTTREKIKVFSEQKWADSLLSCLYYGRENNWYLLLSFVIMPEHLHLIVVPQTKNISQIMKAIKGYSARIMMRDKNVPPIHGKDIMMRDKNVPPIPGKDRRGFPTQHNNSLWQEGFYDYILDTEGKLLTKIKYIEENPVRAGLVSEAEFYRYSSAHKQNSVDLEIYLNKKDAGQECPAYPAQERQL